jgi:lysophospholipase L1-like esterase
VTTTLARYATEQVEEGATATSYVPFEYTVTGDAGGTPVWFNARGASRWTGKKWLALGDSVTFREDYQPLVAAEIGFASVVTSAVSGSTTRSMTNPDRLTAAMLTGVDLVTVFAPFNDYGLARPLGTMADPLGTESFYADVKKVITDILALKPTVSIALVGAHQLNAGPPYYPSGMYAPNSIGAKLTDYLEVMRVVSAHYGVPFLDLAATSGINEYNLLTYTEDGLHANAAGMSIIAHLIAGFLQSSVAPKPHAE